jgi:phenylacetate-CoA ligase
MRDLSWREMLGLAAGLLSIQRFLKRTPFLSPEEMRAWQFARLQALVAQAYDKVPFYRRLYDSASFHPEDLKDWEDFLRVPVVTKDQVIANFPEGMLARGYRLEDLTVSRSSGSSGKVLDIAYDPRAMTTYILAGLRLYRMGFPYRPWHRQVYIYTSPYPLDSLFGAYPLHFLSTLTPPEEILKALGTLRPDLLICYPSHLKQLTQLATPEQRAKIRLRAISVNSEMSAQAERDELSSFWGCPVLDEYSSEELTRIAAQCLRRTYHVFEDVNYLEVLDEAGRPTTEMGTLVGTNLHNFAMPMIRYQQNDLGRIEAPGCACGWAFRRLTHLEGRRNDSFVLPSGKVLSSGFLLDATYEFLLAYRAAVRDFCLIQESPAGVVLRVIPGSGWSDEVAGKISRRFAEFLEPGVSFHIQPVAECEKTRTGKRNPIINRTTRST